MNPRRLVRATTLSITSFRFTVIGGKPSRGAESSSEAARPSLLDDRSPYLSLHSVRPPIHVSCCETQHPKSGICDQVLAPVVIPEPVAMVAPVELDDQSCGWVIEVGSADESPGHVVEVTLDLGRRQSSLQQQPP